MNSRFIVNPVVIILILVSVFLGNVHAETWLLTYHADANSLPDQQGWGCYNDPNDTEPWIDSGLLRTDTTILQYLYWYSLDKIICFPADYGLIAEWQIKINSSELVDISQNRWRIGYIVSITDLTGRLFRIGITENGVIISNDSNWNYDYSSPFVGYDTTDDFHTYRFIIQNNTGQLYIDDVPIVSLQAGASNQMTANRVVFGDATYHSANDTEMTWFRFGLTKKQGDVNNDDEINLVDLNTFALYWLEENCNCPDCCEGADLNQSGWVDLQDFALLAGGWLD